MSVVNDRGLPVIIKEMIEDSKYTNDLLFLQKIFSYIPLFVYGAEQRSFSSHSMLQGCPRVGVGTTVPENFSMFIFENEPVALKDDDPTTRGRLYGEIYRVPPSVIVDLDRMLCKGVHFKREMLPIQYWVPERNVEQYVSEAMVYTGITGAWIKAIDTRQAVRKRNLLDTKGKFYRYLKSENEPVSDAAHTHVM